MTSKETQTFQDKNETRRKARALPDYQGGRESRREFATNGAFGNLEGWVYNECSKGTVNGRQK